LALVLQPIFGQHHLTFLGLGFDAFPAAC
jgi:hypothetical protein